MSSSSIQLPVFQAKVSNIQNQADSSSIYSSGQWSFKNSTAVASVTITDAGNVGIGTASPSARLDIQSANQALNPVQVRFNTSNELLGFGIANSNGFPYLGYNTKSAVGTDIPTYERSSFATQFRMDNGEFKFSTAVSGTAGNAITFTERMRIDASGNFFLGKTTTGTSQAGFQAEYSAGNIAVFNVINASGAANTYHLFNQNATNNGFRFYVKANGGIDNFQANNGNLSDERVKANISLASNYLEKICSIPVKTFRYKDQGDDMDLTLGVIAQDVEKVAPELVNTTDGFGDLPEDGVPLKTIYQTDLQYALMKCIQELSAKNEALEARLAALESK